MLLYRWFYYQPQVFISEWKIPLGLIIEGGRFVEMPRQYTELPEDKQRLINTAVDIIKLNQDDWFTTTRRIASSITMGEIQMLSVVWEEDNLDEAVMWIQRNMMPNW